MKPEEKHRQINEAKWNEWAGSLDGSGLRNEFLRRAQVYVIHILDLKPGVTLLDIGCGTGYAIGQAANVVNNRGKFYGVDLSPKMVEKARENFKGNENVHFVTASAESIPLEDNSFDIIICNHSFHHYLNPAKAVQEMHRLLKPGGKVHILDPTADSWIVRLIRPIMPIFDRAHVKMYSTDEFRQLFISGGLHYVGTQALNPHQKVHIAEKK